MTTRQKYWLHFRTAKQPTMQVRVHIEAQTARNFGLGQACLEATTYTASLIGAATHIQREVSPGSTAWPPSNTGASSGSPDSRSSSSSMQPGPSQTSSRCCATGTGRRRERGFGTSPQLSVPAAARAPPEGTRSCHRKHHGRARRAPLPGTARAQLSRWPGPGSAQRPVTGQGRRRRTCEPAPAGYRALRSGH